MKTFRNYIKDEFDIEMPQGDIPGGWFYSNGLPIIVSCTCCGMTMASPSALIDRTGQVFCHDCGDPDDDSDPIPEDAEDLGDWDYNEDMGFDPYLGCYTDDC